MEKLEKGVIVSKKNKEEYFEYAIRFIKNRRMILVHSQNDLIVGNDVFVLCEFVNGQYINPRL